MRKLVSVLLTLAVAVSLMLVPAVASASPGAPTIDGVVEEGEWDGATVIDVASGMGTVSVIARADYLYVLFNLVDLTDARAGENLGGNDQISINVNPTDGGSWGFPYDLIFETSADLPWDSKVNSGTLDGWNTRWFPDNAQQDLPGDLESATIYTGAERITEWKLPLASTPGDILKVGGAIEVGDGSSYPYPVDLAWDVASTFVDILVQQPSATVGLSAEIEEITAISVNPTSIDYDTISPGYDYTHKLTVSNTGSVPVSVTTEITGDTLFTTCLTLEPATINPLKYGSPASVGAHLQVPLSYHAQGLETGTIIFEATALP